MGTFVIQPKIAKAEALAKAEEAIKGIEAFFRANPKRRVCHSQLFYSDVMVSIKKKDVRKQVLNIVETLGNEDRFI